MRKWKVHPAPFELSINALYMTTDIPEQLPTRVEVAYGHPDGSDAIEHFYGKTLAEAQEIFAEASDIGISLDYTQDFYSMNPVGFRFYIRAAIRHCLSERADGDPELINGLEGAIDWWLGYSPSELISCAPLLADFCNGVLERYDRYEAKPHIYIGLREKYEHLAETFKRMANDHGDAHPR